jgi:DNA-binding response OmpR family regulator
MAKPMTFQTISLTELALKGIAPHRGSHKPAVLVVDDEAVIADTLAVILSQHGFATMVAYDGTTALRIAQTVPPDLLLTDVVMPGMSGVDLAVAIRQSLPNCKVLLFSGQAATVDLLAAAGDAGRDFTVLSKPLHPKELLARLTQTLSSPVSSRGGKSLEPDSFEAVSL